MYVCSSKYVTTFCVCEFLGFLLGNLPDEHFSHMNMGSVTKGRYRCSIIISAVKRYI